MLPSKVTDSSTENILSWPREFSQGRRHSWLVMLPFYKNRTNRSQRIVGTSWSILAICGTFLASPSHPSISSRASSAAVHAASSSVAGSSSSLTPEKFDQNSFPSLARVDPSDHQDYHYPQVASDQQAFLPTASPDVFPSSRISSHEMPNSRKTLINLKHPYHKVLRPSPSKLMNKDATSRFTSRQLNRRQEDQSGSPSSPSFPQPFDTSLGTDFESDTCEPFMSAFLNNAAFQECHAFSLLVTTSSAFFQSVNAMSSPSTNNDFRFQMPLSTTLDAACQADTANCETLFDRLALDIKSRQIGCGKDLDKNNSLPLQALNGFKNYRLMHDIGCLTTDETDASPQAELTAKKLNTTSSSSPANASISYGTSNSTFNGTQVPLKYCFEKAASSLTPDNLYYYYLPLGTNLPSGTRPSCDHCMKSIMKLYSIAAANSSLAIQATYPPARMMTNLICGPGFAPATVNPGSRFASSAGSRVGTSFQALSGTEIGRAHV